VLARNTEAGLLIDIVPQDRCDASGIFEQLARARTLIHFDAAGFPADVRIGTAGFPAADCPSQL
jgi:hypothetical protein